jgi:hypothetical protein
MEHANVGSWQAARPIIERMGYVVSASRTPIRIVVVIERANPPVRLLAQGLH